MEDSKFLKQKSIYLIVLIVTIILIVLLSTYALLEWTGSETTELTLRIGETSGLICTKENDLNVTNLGPVFDYEESGEYVEFTALNLTKTPTQVDISLVIKSITDNLKRNDFKYVLLSSTDKVTYTKLTEGNFSNANDSDVIEYSDTISDDTYYKMIFYIDGNMNNDISMQNGSLHAGLYFCGDVPELQSFASAIIEKTTETPNACGAGESGICPTNEYTDENGETKYHEYRYRGAEVDNYVWFNNDMYRIIGVFDDYTHGVEGEYLVKLIAANPLSSNSWGVYNTTLTSETYSSYNNDWTGNTTGIPANTNILLNQFFYNKTKEVTGYSNCSTWTYFYSTVNYRPRQYDCSDIVGYGIDDSVRGYIEEVTWHLKGYKSTSYNKQQFYTCERSGDTTITDCNSGSSGTYSKTTTGHIGLMYASDYVYASSYYASTDTTKVGTGYHGNKNWLYKGYEWTITPDSDIANSAFSVYSYGNLYSVDASYGLGVRPAFYLKFNVSINDGEGTFENPFTLSM